MPRLLLISIFSILACKIYAQDDRSTEKNILYTHATNFGLIVHTRGYGADVQLVKQRSVNDNQLIDLNIVELKHPKEISQPNSLISGSSPYIFGKLNNLVVLNMGYGTRYVIADRNNPDDIKINLNYTFGPVVGWMKPVYYQIRLPTTDGSDPKLIEAKFDPDNVLYQKNTVGVSPSLFKGINESFFIYGGCAKIGLNFEWGKLDYKYFSLETGLMVDAFPAPVPIFATIKNDRVFANLYLSISYGIRK